MIFCESPVLPSPSDGFVPTLPFCYSQGSQDDVAIRNPAVVRVTLLKTGETRALCRDCITFLDQDGESWD
jgi:hypothetical protein